MNPVLVLTVSKILVCEHQMCRSEVVVSLSVIDHVFDFFERIQDDRVAVDAVKMFLQCIDDVISFS